MDTDQRADRLIDDLDTALRETIGLHHANTVTEWLEQGNVPRYLMQPKLLMAQHFDIEPVTLIYDGKLGTLGIVELVLANRKDSVSAQVRKHLDAATYARHLLLRDRARGLLPALTVELVLLTADETEEDRNALVEIGSELRRLLQTTESLHQVGISVLLHQGHQTAFEGQLRRAFPWLLRATQHWFASPRSQPPAEAVSNSAPDRLTRLCLFNYRLPGQRDITLANSQVHLIHGPNGSGKSSLVEALELVSSGKIERLEQPGERINYERVIKSRRGQGAPAIIELWWNNDTTPHTFRVEEKGLAPPPIKEVHASSFRLDQQLMTRLVGQSPPERARTFVQAFFPEMVRSLERYTEATRARDEACDKLAPTVESLITAKKALEELQDWRGSNATRPSDEFPALLNSWLELTALVDIAPRARGLLATFRAARDARWQSNQVNALNLVQWVQDAQLDVAALAEQEKEWDAKKEGLQRELASFSSTPPPDQRRDDKSYSVTKPQLQALNVVSPWLFADHVLQSYGRFGDKLARVIATGDAPTYGHVIIGREDWAPPLIAELEAMIRVCEDLKTDKPPVPWPGKAQYGEYETAAKQQQEVVTSGEELSMGFFDKLRADDDATGEYDGSLIAAVNELLALFTPARWAYDDIQLPSRRRGGKVELAIALGQGASAVRADLQLNTAELNAFTIALFLLCAGRVTKPFGAMVFDDILQNMDELTSTALARGVAKLVRLWEMLGRREELIFLFHGFEDLERFQRELPAAIYRLPWLSPSSRPTILPPIRAETDNSSELQPQSLMGLFESTSDNGGA
jgi:energy-coupling factor transporter ATP-binding protein EcfA2